MSCLPPSPYPLQALPYCLPSHPLPWPPEQVREREGRQRGTGDCPQSCFGLAGSSAPCQPGSWWQLPAHEGQTAPPQVLSPAPHRPLLSSLVGITSVGALTCPWSFPFPSLPWPRVSSAPTPSQGASPLTDEAWLLVQAQGASPRPQASRRCAGQFRLRSGSLGTATGWRRAGGAQSLWELGLLGEGPGRLQGELESG